MRFSKTSRDNKFYLDVEQEVHYIAIFNDIIFAFRSHLTGFFRALFTFIGNKVVKSDSLGADKAFFEVGMDFTCCLRRGLRQPE